MLNQNQLRRLEAIDRWLREILDSEEFRQIEYYPDVTLGDAIQAVGELLDEHEHYDYKPINFPNSDCVYCNLSRCKLDSYVCGWR
jgi:hypothetical protein